MESKYPKPHLRKLKNYWTIFVSFPKEENGLYDIDFVVKPSFVYCFLFVDWPLFSLVFFLIFMLEWHNSVIWVSLSSIMCVANLCLAWWRVQSLQRHVCVRNMQLGRLYRQTVHCTVMNVPTVQIESINNINNSSSQFFIVMFDVSYTYIFPWTALY